MMSPFDDSRLTLPVREGFASERALERLRSECVTTWFPLGGDPDTWGAELEDALADAEYPDAVRATLRAWYEEWRLGMDAMRSKPTLALVSPTF